MAWLNEAGTEVLEQPFQSPDLNPIENMWTVLKKQVCARKLTNEVELHRFCQEEWFKIQPEDDQKHVDGQETFNQILKSLFIYFKPSRFGHIFRRPLSDDHLTVVLCISTADIQPDFGAPVQAQHRLDFFD